MPIKREIIYPIFLECCQFTDDKFWENVFEDLAYGKTPYGTYISKDFLCCSYKKKEFSYKIEKKLPKDVYNDVYDLLTNKLGLLSPLEKSKKRKIFKDIEEDITESRKNWNDIKKKNIKELLIELYVARMKNKHSLTLKQARYLLSIIFVGMIFKVITNKDVDYKNGKIENIDGIEISHKKIDVKKDLYNLDNNFTPTIILDKNLMYDNWEKYLKELKKISC
jgi:hypothetical protein|tara:strand:- start:96 stop:761 length:666 start_codon:yes stop_codon:yes gene_type:complete